MALKVVVVGESAVGKTSLIMRLTGLEFNPNVEPSTKVEMFSTEVECDGINTQVNLWDTCANDKYRSLGAIYYKGSKLGIIVYDMTRRATFDSVELWAKELRQHAFATLPLCLVATMADRESSRQVSREEGEALAAKLKMNYFEVSLKNGTGLEFFQPTVAKTVQLSYQRSEVEIEPAIPHVSVFNCDFCSVL